MAKLNAWLRPNNLTEDKSDYIAVPQTADSLYLTSLAAGVHTLRVTTQHIGGSISLKLPHVSTFDKPLAPYPDKISSEYGGMLSVIMEACYQLLWRHAIRVSGEKRVVVI